GVGGEAADRRGRIPPRRLLDVAPLVPGDLREGAPRDGRARLRRRNVVGRRESVAMLDEEPGGLAPRRPGPCADEHPRPAELRPRELELELSLCHGGWRSPHLGGP